LVAIALAGLVGLGLTACGDNPGTTASDGAGSSVESPAPAEPAASDVMFAQMMIPHHEQAIEMADLAGDRAQSAEVLALAEDIKAAQDPEIDLMTGWLEAWGEDVPMPGMGMDHSGHDMGSMSDSMTGMMSAEDMEALAAASGAEFDQMWLEMMIEHHEGALAMAEQVQDSDLPDVRGLAKAIIAGQTAEIETMQGLLAQ
jgi:uncharacterized protein (DUF305 family)